jgi:CubicO group peptidase (beta-lactamase class C family)
MFSLFLATTSAQKGTVSGFDPARLDAISARIESYVSERQIAGAVGMIRRNGKTVYFKPFGKASLEPERDMKPDTIFQVM